MRSSPRQILVPLLLVPLLAADPAFGAPRERGSGNDDIISRVERLHVEGAALFRAGRHREAVDKFREAYELYPEPNLIYNTARCFEAMGELALAIEHYRRFLRHPEAATGTRRRAEQKLSLLLEARRSARPAASATVIPKGPLSPRSAARPGSTRNAFGWVLLSAGVAAAAGGTVSFLLGTRDHGRVEDAIDEADGQIVAMGRAEAVELRDSGELKKWIGVGLWGAAGALLVTSAVLFSLDGSEERDPTRRGSGVNVALTPTRSGGALLVGGRF